MGTTGSTPINDDANTINKRTSGSTQKAASSDNSVAGGGAASNATIAGNRTTAGSVAGSGEASSVVTTNTASTNSSNSSNSSDNSATADATQGRNDNTILRGQASLAVQIISKYLPPGEKSQFVTLTREHQSIFHPDTGTDKRKGKIASNLLIAVAYGMESSDVNVRLSKDDVTIKTENNVRKKLFNPDLYAKDLLQRSPEYLLKRARLTDWAGRTFKGRITEEHPEGEGITAFEYALWAKDFKMIEMMLSCIRNTAEGDDIRAQLLEQANQVRAPVDAGGGLSYSITYKKPRVDANNGIPTKDAAGVWQDDVVTEEHTENHFNSAPLMQAYQDYINRFDTLNWDEREAFWVRKIGTLQRLLPVHILQRYCDPGVPFYPLPQFNGPFRRSTIFYDWVNNAARASIFSSVLSIDFGLLRARAGGGIARLIAVEGVRADSAAIRQLDEVSTNEMNNVIQRLHDDLLRAQHTGGFQP